MKVKMPNSRLAEDQRGLAAVAVADPAENLRAEQHADIAGAEHEAELLGRDVPFLDQARRRKGDGADVVAVDHGEQHGPDDELDLERAQPVLVQEMRDLNFRFAGHRFPRRIIFVAGRLCQSPRKESDIAARRGPLPASASERMSHVIRPRPDRPILLGRASPLRSGEA